MEETQTQKPQPLKVNHSVRIVILSSREQLLTLVTDIRDDANEVIGYKLLWPFILHLGEPNENGDLPIRYTKWCPFTPVQEFQVKPNSITTVAFPDNNILENYISELESYGIPRDKLFFEEAPADGNNSEPAETGE